MKFRRRPPSPALAVSIVALVVATAGTGYAAFTLPKNSVGSRQLKANAVISSKVKDRSLLARDFKAGQLPAGAQGLKGDKGDKGDTGAAGSAYAFAHVNNDATLDTANSSGVTASPKVTNGVYCLTVTGTPRNAVASADSNEGTTVIAGTNLSPGGQITSGNCPAGTNAIVTISSTSGAPANHAFYVAFNK